MALPSSQEVQVRPIGSDPERLASCTLYVGPMHWVSIQEPHLGVESFLPKPGEINSSIKMLALSLTNE